jgi:hypothetical protein
MLKPRISYIGLGLMYGVGRADWVCRGFGSNGYGWSPEAAYEDWRRRRREDKSRGLQRVRERRLAAEKRIKDREERRKMAKTRTTMEGHMSSIYAAEAKRRVSFWERILG